MEEVISEPHIHSANQNYVYHSGFGQSNATMTMYMITAYNVHSWFVLSEI